MISFRKVVTSDIDSIVNIHLEVFTSFFLTSLGRSFLKIYYKSSVKFKDCISVCALNEQNEIIGFAVGTYLSKGYHKKLILNNIFGFSIQFMVLLFSRPKAILRLARNISKVQHPMDDGFYAELLSIAVSKTYKGQGVGKLLLNKFEEAALSFKCSKIALTTDFYNNDQVIGFYQGMGYHVLYEFVTYPERKMYKMLKDIS